MPPNYLSKELSIVKTFTGDISMQFGLDKCAIAIMMDGRQIKSQNMQYYFVWNDMYATGVFLSGI